MPLIRFLTIAAAVVFMLNDLGFCPNASTSAACGTCTRLTCTRGTCQTCRSSGRRSDGRCAGNSQDQPQYRDRH